MKTQILSLIILFFTFQSFAQTGQPPFQDDSLKAGLKTVPIQFTFLTPPISTNGIYFYKTINDVSLNIFVGVGAASNYLELGSFLNINRFYSNGVQLAGFGNISGFDRDAYKFGSKGVQLSGFFNLNGNDYTGLQAAGFINVNKDFNGLQASGFMNVDKDVENSLQIAGFANVDRRAENSYQVAGFANIAKKGTNRVQAAGFLNVSENIGGVQAAGFSNVARDVEGAQISGFINVARNVKGTQIAGFINICDSIEGIPIGFINIVRKNGYRNFEISTSEWSPVQITYRMGVEKFYNIYTLSKLAGGWDRFAFGFGVGHNHSIFDKTDLNIELVHHQEFVIRPNFITFYPLRENSISQLKIGVRRNIFNNVWVNAGPTFNLALAYNPVSSTTDYGVDLQPYLWKATEKVYTRYPNWNYRFWVGFSAGISFN